MHVDVKPPCTTVEKKSVRFIPVKGEWGPLVQRARDAAGISKAALADRIGLSPSMVSRIESGSVFITPDVFRRLTTELRSLKAYELANALGYEVTVAGADRLPRQLVRDLLEMNPDDLLALARLVHRNIHGGSPPVGQPR